MTARDVDTWNAWIDKNSKKDKTYFRKLARMAGIAVLIGLACVLIWSLSRHEGKALELAGTQVLSRQ
jgi:hypothetical protein